MKGKRNRCVLASSGRYNKIPQTVWLNSSHSLEAGSLRSVCQHGQVLVRAVLLAYRWLYSHCILTWPFLVLQVGILGALCFVLFCFFAFTNPIKGAPPSWTSNVLGSSWNPFGQSLMMSVSSAEFIFSFSCHEPLKFWAAPEIHLFSLWGCQYPPLNLSYRVNAPW